MQTSVPYCGLPPAPGDLLGRFNLDPVAITVLCVIAIWQVWTVRRNARRSGEAVAGWTMAAAAFFSPLCALSVALFSARVGQHMILVLLAAPLIAAGMPTPARFAPARLAVHAVLFAVALWLWHMPAPYEATFRSDLVYWAMHVTLFGSAILLWRDLIHHPAEQGFAAMAAGLLTSVQMGLLGAILTFAGTPLFPRHLASAPMWGMSPLTDQQLGGLLMWVPGIALFIAAAKLSLDMVLKPGLSREAG